jgi:allantoate deiminase
MQFDLAARLVMERCDILGTYSEDTDYLTRRFATPPMQQVNALVATWMLAAGMSVHYDCVGNLIGRYEALELTAKTMVFGSHLDTVCDAGKYDGPLGVLTALACVEHLHEQERRLPFAIEILGFADEEGLRYHTTYLGSRAITGTFDVAALQFVDDDGIKMLDAIQQFGGQPDPILLRTARWQSEDLLGYCEIHIEQGPVLEARELPVGVVTSIAGQHRYLVNFLGQAGHAGTVPMDMRHDALCAASEFFLAIEAQGRETPGLVATVGKVQVHPGASNVIPGRVLSSLDVRHQAGDVLAQACDDLQMAALRICFERDITLDWQCIQKHKTIFCAPQLSTVLKRAIEEENFPIYELPSGAGHDAVAMSELTDVTMLFVRCKGGISHHANESVKVEDVAVSLCIIDRFLDHLCRMRGE